MTATKEKTPSKGAEEQAGFYLIFDELAKAEAGNPSDVSPEEIDEIEQVRRIVMEVMDDRPIFMTST